MESDGHGEEEAKVKERKGEGREEGGGVRFFSNEIVKSATDLWILASLVTL